MNWGFNVRQFTPQTFWALTLPEVVAMLGFAPQHLSRETLNQLMQTFPDKNL